MEKREGENTSRLNFPQIAPRIAQNSNDYNKNLSIIFKEKIFLFLKKKKEQTWTSSGELTEEINRLIALCMVT